MKKIFKTLLFLCVIVVSSSCTVRNYTCNCIDSNGNPVIESDGYLGNDPDGYIIMAENILESENGYTNCVCEYD